MSGLVTPILAFYLRRARRPAFASAAALQAAIAAARRVEDPRPPPKVVGGLQVSRRALEGMTVYELGLKGAAGAPLLYLPGGLFCFQITRLHWAMIVELAVATGRRVVVPISPPGAGDRGRGPAIRALGVVVSARRDRACPGGGGRFERRHLGAGA